MGAANADAGEKASPSGHFAWKSLYNADPARLLRRYVTMDETWAHHFDPETKQQSKQWKHVTSPTPVKFRKIASAGKVTASVF